ncbi:PX domain-containing protein kinase-like protein [Episyrphus balteatus]|uniref:PX domain-containing protein kinase-like protein n=1 Tax=Episyrphus balteatus TaxID=286459 RepID=UPI0024851BEF|nr:PX domain-containing protein kinase-like protein [Episyrphus balteatus]
MAIFEQKHETKITLDDTLQVNCFIETAQTVNGHTEYLLRLQRGPLKENSWKILRRYNDFAELNRHLQPSGIVLPMPGKKLIGNMRPDFIAERRQQLQEYIDTVLMNPILASSLPAKRFVDPDSYSQSFHDQAVQNASLCLRTEGHYLLGQTMGAIGWRLRKHYFKVTPKPPEKSSSKHLVKSGSQSHQAKHFASSSNGSGSLDSGLYGPGEIVLEWVEFGPDKYMDDKEIHSVLKSFVGLQHPYIDPIVYAASNENGSAVVRRFHKQGTLKDILCMSTPKNPFLNKYGNPKGRTTLSLKQIALYGRQILEALSFLHAKGMPYGHLHSGNIVIEDDCVKLLDIENYILGVPAFYRPFFVQHSKLHSAEIIDVYCFGHVLFEMTFGYPLQESVARQISDCAEDLKNILELILSKEACRAGLPTLDQLIEHRFFTEHVPSLRELTSPGDGSTKPHFKLSVNAKEQIRIATQKCESRLRDEQKSVKNQKRLVRVQELMSSEEERKKSKQKAKLEHKQSKLRQQNSLQANNGRTPSASSGGGTSGNLGTLSVRAAPFNRSDSVLSVNVSNDTASTPPPSSGNSSSPLPAVPPPLPPTTPVEQSLSPKSAPNVNEEGSRSVLLESISKFNRGSLRKVRSND